LKAGEQVLRSDEPEDKLPTADAQGTQRTLLLIDEAAASLAKIIHSKSMAKLLR